MRNSKTKGFTLVELIVVIAIIAVLAAILVPSLTSYVRKSKITAANANAKVVYNALIAALTDADIHDVTITAGAQDDVVIKIDKDELKKTWCDLTDALGTGYNGYARAIVNTKTYGLSYVLYTEKKDLFKDSLDDLKQLKSSEQTGKGDIIGCYPLILDNTTTSTTA